MEDALCELCYSNQELEHDEEIYDCGNEHIGDIYYCNGCRIKTEVYFD